MTDNQRQPVPLAKAYLLLNHGPVTLVSTAFMGQRNVMAASWVTPLDFDPPKVTVVVDRQTLTRELLEASGEFVLNIPTRAQADQVLCVGSVSGKDQDKFDLAGLTATSGSCVAAPLVKGCAAWLECRVMPVPENQQRHDLFIGEVVAAWADPGIFSNGRWHFPDAEHRTIHYAAGGHFFMTGEGFDLK